ncbi:HlyD family efflux transporter periplasmic adaptor subunit [Cellulomonas sp. JH27-2]|uniref:HlyD family efflux transporter periplasmic adaptor subunit n=1 Tax=Cellulomonas sp. JH27-2 TaxID=2774139 RepID=UPI0017860935|nr:HlyD family efflux transporter periplasmic adaptor subunit [Cellulomonas sp. JH27-2]MBD8057499.1 HlyD family efflux transporter periplasmic adaptor subunit [Cellulomonas sp. JH27-2]
MRDSTRPASKAAARRRSRRRRFAIITAVAVVLATLVGGGVALAAGRSEGDRYRTATASLGSVTQRVDAVGTVSSAARRDAAFAVAGTVKKVDVEVGDKVDAGDTLATLDKSDLQADVDAAEADLADAEQQLQDDLDSQTSTTSTTSSTTSTAATATSASSMQAATISDGVLRASTTPTVSSAVYTASASTTPTTTAAATTAATTTTTSSDDVDDALAAVEKAQDALLTQYTAVTKQLTASGDAVDSEAAACKAFLAVTDTSQASSTGDVLTITPGTAAAGSAVKVSASGVSGSDPVQIVLKSTGAVLAEVTPDGGSFTVGVVIPSSVGTGEDALQLVSAGSTVSSTKVTITAAKDSTVADALATCQRAIDDTLDAQQDVGAGQDKLMDLAKDLDDAVSALSDAVDAASTDYGGSTDGGTTPTPAPTPTPSASSDPSGGKTGGKTGGKNGGSTDGGTTDGGTPNGKPGTTDDGGTGNGTPNGGTPNGTTGGTDDGGTGNGGTGGSGTGGTGGTGTGGTGGGGETAKVASAADIVADRAAIDVAEQDVDIAKSQLALVTLTSPISGTVAAVDLAKGDSVQAGSTTAVITVVGGTGYTVSTTVPLGSIDVVKVGQSAAVTVRSTDEALTGTVSSMGVTNVSTSSSTPSYAVDLEVDTDTQLYDGSSAQVRIEVAGGAKVLTVPTSAVHMDGSQASVQVLSGDSVKSVDVTRGAVGSELTEITKGLTQGQKVVLADLKEPMESGDDSSSGGLSGLGGSSDQQRGAGSFQGGPPGGGNFGGGNFGGGGNR